MDTSHKHRKGFRQDAEMLSEAYESVYNDSQQLNEIAPVVAAGLGYLGGAAVKGAAKGIYKGVTDPATSRGHEEINVSTSDEVEDNELSDDWQDPNYRGDAHDFQPGEIIEVGPWGPNDEADHLEVVLQIKGDQVNTIPITDDAYGAQYGGRGGLDIKLIRPQSDSYFDDSDYKPADGREY
jgi:hypothetical protein